MAAQLTGIGHEGVRRGEREEKDQWSRSQAIWELAGDKHARDSDELYSKRACHECSGQMRGVWRAGFRKESGEGGAQKDFLFLFLFLIRIM